MNNDYNYFAMNQKYYFRGLKTFTSIIMSFTVYTYNIDIIDYLRTTKKVKYLHILRKLCTYIIYYVIIF
jgi:hypothetical protein